ncbi:MAG: response regulator [Candidatus Contendobacter sp.]
MHLTRAAFARFLDGLPPSPEPTSGRPPSPRTLLILDDSPTLRERLRQVLADDYHLVEAATGRAALAACAGETPPDLLLVDLNLGSSPGQENDLSGLDVVRQLKGAIPCVVLTVDRSRETRRAALQAGAWAYLVKPPEPDTLHAALEAALVRSRDATRAETQRVIDIATGILMAHHHLGEDEARRLLKALASADRRTVQDVAESIISAQRFQSRLARMASQKRSTPPEGA